LPKDSNQCNKGLDHKERKSVNNVRWVEAFQAGEVIGKAVAMTAPNRAPKLAKAKTKQNGIAVRT